MEFFLNPWSMVAGGALVSSPIIIHLINRMKFKRIRWAAMEFLLKSQKRNRRRLIIEQLILLLLRILLVLLAAFLVARFVGSALGLTQSTASTHILILDDTLSMRDKWEGEGAIGLNTFEKAKSSVLDLARHAAEESSPHYFTVYALSNSAPVFPKTKVNAEMLTKLRQTLDTVEPTYLYLPPNDGIERARKELAASTEGRKYLHVFSDYRERDWANGPLSTDLKKQLDQLAEGGTDITLIDVANPGRRGKKPPAASDNLAIVSVKPESRIAPEGRPIKVDVEIANFGTTTYDSLFLEVYRDDEETWNPEFSRLVVPPAPGQRVTHSFEINFTGVKTHHITVKLQREEKTGIDADNVRYAVVEVRKKVPVLVIDGSPEISEQIGSDTRTIINALEAAKRYEVISKTVEELQRPDLAKAYTTIYLLNVPQIGEVPKEEKPKKKKEGDAKDAPEAEPKEEAQPKKKAELTPAQKQVVHLMNFVKEGGNIVFFTGEKIDKDHYNKELYENAGGLFPVPLAERKSPPIPPEKLEQFSLQPKLYVRDKDHPVTEGIFPEQNQFAFLNILHYSPTLERFNWKPELSGPEQLRELITLPNNKTVDSYKAQTQLLLGQIPTDTATLAKKVEGLYASLPEDERPDAYKRLANRLDERRDGIIDILSTAKDDELYLLADGIEELLNDEGNRDDDSKPDLTKFWDFPTMKDLQARLQAFYNEVKFGFPLAVDRQYGQGHVLAVLTTAGSQWHNWPGGSPVSYTFPIVMSDLVRYLTSGGATTDTFVGTSINFELDAERYKGSMESRVRLELGKDAKKDAKAVDGFTPVGTQEVPKKDGQYQFIFNDTGKPGLYSFHSTPIDMEEEGQTSESTIYALNIHTEGESNLARAPYAELERNPQDAPKDRGRINLISSDPREVTKLLKQDSKDISESPWLYLFILMVLVIEQALAVHLSHHLKGSQAAAPGAAAEPVSRGASVTAA